jgi:hypothetical protein
MSRPALEPPPEPGAALRERLASAVRWRDSTDVDFPWEAYVHGEVWRIRLNDFPEECLYGLWVDGACLGEFDEWPEAWDRPGLAARAEK